MAGKISTPGRIVITSQKGSFPKAELNNAPLLERDGLDTSSSGYHRLLCPECRGAMVAAGGCFYCPGCGFSECRL